MHPKRLASVGLAVWTGLCALDVWYILQDEEIAYDAGAAAGDFAMVGVVVVVWLAFALGGILLLRYLGQRRSL